ncbi:MAG TPA: septum formation initiator family protein [candidate division Zixibacteria bacterium]|nr:septum formation initiator family protein [candidate division Zixibacteria bacterium]
MTGIDASASAPRPSTREPRIRVTLPASRGGLAWLLVLLIVGAFVAFQLGRQVYASWAIEQEVARYEAQIAAIREENAALQRELDYLESDAYLSQEVRRLKNLGKPGEHVLIIPPGAEATLPPAVQEEHEPPPPPLEQWLDLFFGE